MQVLELRTSDSDLLTDVFLNQVCTKNGRKNSTYPRTGWGWGGGGASRRQFDFERFLGMDLNTPQEPILGEEFK